MRKRGRLNRVPSARFRKGVTSKRSASRSSDQEVMRHLSRSQIFKDYERAFSEAMGLPLNIRGHDSWSPAHHGKEDHDSFASILARFNKARAACLRAQTDASREPDSTTRTVTWFAGLSESAVPVYVGDHILGFLETGEVFLGWILEHHFARLQKTKNVATYVDRHCTFGESRKPGHGPPCRIRFSRCIALSLQAGRARLVKASQN